MDKVMIIATNDKIVYNTILPPIKKNITDVYIQETIFRKNFVFGIMRQINAVTIIVISIGVFRLRAYSIRKHGIGQEKKAKELNSFV